MNNIYIISIENTEHLKQCYHFRQEVLARAVQLANLTTVSQFALLQKMANL